MADTLAAAVPSSNSPRQQPAAPFELELNRAKRQDRSNISSSEPLVLPSAPKRAEPPQSSIASQYKQVTNLARFDTAKGAVEDMAMDALKSAAKQAIRRGLLYYGPPALLAILATVIGMCVLFIFLYGGYCFYHMGITDSVKIWWSQDITSVLKACSE